MRVFAACAASYRESVRRAAGVPPVLSPPLDMDTFDSALWSGYGFYYFKLHGLPGQPFWYGDRFLTAVSDDQLRQVDMTGAMVFVAGCNLFQEDPPYGPMLSALWDAGACAVVGGTGENFGARLAVVGADALGINIRRAAQLGASPQLAFDLAMKRLRLFSPWRMSTLEERAYWDALDFRLLFKGVGSRE